MENIEGLQLLDITDEDLAPIIKITKENMAQIIKEVWELDWNKGFEERYMKCMLSSGVVKTAYNEDDFIGYCWFCERDDENEVFINSIQLRKDYQGRGLGLRILRWIEHNAVNRKVQYLSLAVQESNPKAIGIYLRFGFREVFRENGSILMRKKLF